MIYLWFLVPLALLLLAPFIPCEHAWVYPGRDTETGVFYFMCAREGCRHVKLSLNDKWMPPEKVEAAFKEAAAKAAR